MDTAIIYHSKTGITERFANSLAEALKQKGHSVTGIKLQTSAPVKQASVRDKQEISFTNLPDLSAYDLLIFGGPVWAFGSSPVIIAAIKQCTGLQGKTAIPIATMGFPLKFLGGTGALDYMKRELAARGAKVIPGQVCRQMMKKLDGDIVAATREICSSIG